MEKLDLTKILKVGDKVWSPVVGEGIVKSLRENTNPYSILVEILDGAHDTTFNREGKYLDYSPECTLFPSKDHRVWDDEAIMIIRPPKKGDYLISENNNCFIYNGIHEFGKYGAIVGVIKGGYITFDLDDKSANFTSQVARYATPEEIEEFDKLLKSKGYYFDKEKLELQKYRWRADLNKKYHYIDARGNVCCASEDNMLADSDRFSFGNYFETPEEAAEVLKQVKELLNTFHNGNN